MPFVRLPRRKGKAASCRPALSEAVQDATLAEFDGPERDRFAPIHEYGGQSFVHDPTCLG